MIIPLFVSFKGCPHRCLFCNQPIINGTAYHGVEDVKSQLRTLAGWVRKDHRNELAFYGGSFTALPLAEQEALLELVMPYRKAGYFTDLRLSTRPDAISPASLSLLRDYGVRTVELGVQSLDDVTLTLLDRGHDAHCVYEATAQLQAAGFAVIHQLMVNLPGETEETLKKTLRGVTAMHPEGCRIYPLLVIEGTKLADWYRKGCYTPLDLAETVRRCAYLYEGLTAAGIPVIRWGFSPMRILGRRAGFSPVPSTPLLGNSSIPMSGKKRLTPLLQSRKAGIIIWLLRCQTAFLLLYGVSIVPIFGTGKLPEGSRSKWKLGANSR